jgi:DNA (cytosine-5)-methyltransferase 1
MPLPIASIVKLPKMGRLVVRMCYSTPVLMTKVMPTSIEICAGGGGQALGLEQAGFSHCLLVDNDEHACKTLASNRPSWNVLHSCVADLDLVSYSGQIDLFAGGVPCPPFSFAGRQLGCDDERDLFPHALRLIEQCQPKAVMLENVRGLLSNKFASYRGFLLNELTRMGYIGEFKLIQCSDFGVPQLRPRTLLVAFRKEYWDYFTWPAPSLEPAYVSHAIIDLLESEGWNLPWDGRKKLERVAPTIVGGSKKHGGPDLGPTRAKREWRDMGIDPMGIANHAPAESFQGLPKLTCKMAARLQGFPDSWQFSGRKTAQYRQIGNAFPPPAAFAVALQISKALASAERQSKNFDQGLLPVAA